MGPYCRTTGDDGFTFFAMHYRTETNNLTNLDLGLMVLTIDGVEPDFPYVPINF